MNNSNWPTNIFDSLNDLKFVEMQLLNIGVALNTVGLDKLSEQFLTLEKD